MNASFKASLTRGTAGPASLLGPVAQWLEPAAHNGLVAGSSPAGPTSGAALGAKPAGETSLSETESNDPAVPLETKIAQIAHVAHDLGLAAAVPKGVS
jgi:hypothetical protein